MIYNCITSMHQPYYDSIGKHMIASWLKYWTGDYKLHLYLEDCEIEFDDSRLVIVDWNTHCKQDWEHFITKTDHPQAHTFAKKGFATLHAWRNIQGDRTVWLDADVLFTKTMTHDVLERSLEGCMIALFESVYRVQPPTAFSAESGYVIVDNTHDQFEAFVDEYERLYRSETKPDTTYNWWDNQVLMAAAHPFRSVVNDLTRYKQRKTQTPLNACWLGEYMKHFKANGKDRITPEDIARITQI